MEKVVLPNDILLNEVDRLLSEGRDVVMMPKGRSMLPFIRGEVDKVLLRKPSAGALQVGDIVLARLDGSRYILHRVVAIDGTRVIMMGDGNLRGREEVAENEVVGKVVEIITLKGRHRKPTRGWLWRQLLPVRKYLLKIYRKTNKILIHKS